jgi:quinol monooxygenase YgiN
MPEIGTVAVITAKPEAADQVGAALADLAAATHGEQGCIMYSLQRGLQETNVFVTVEKWTSQEALEQHLHSAHVQAVLAQAGDLLSVPPHIIAIGSMNAGDASKNSY